LEELKKGNPTERRLIPINPDLAALREEESIMRGNKHLNAAIMEVVENQLRDMDPPETRQTYDRLLAEGIPEKEAKRLLGAVVASEIFDILKKQEPFNLARFTKALSDLPKLPES
jgi:hypothetical protein